MFLASASLVLSPGRPWFPPHPFFPLFFLLTWLTPNPNRPPLLFLRFINLPRARVASFVRYDNGVDRESNVYFALNRALRERKSDPASFQLWQGFLYFVMRALDQLDRFSGTV